MYNVCPMIEKNNIRLHLLFVSGYQNRYYWIGASQAHIASHRFIHNNNEVVARELWYRGEPNQVTTGHLQCVDIGTTGQDMNMCDYSCAESLYYLCQKNPLW